MDIKAKRTRTERGALLKPDVFEILKKQFQPEKSGTSVESVIGDNKNQLSKTITLVTDGVTDSRETQSPGYQSGMRENLATR